MAHGLGLRLKCIVKGLESFQGFDKRLQVQELANGLQLVNDTYNANPASMLAALETVQGASRDHKAVAVLGDMLELGRQSRASHAFIGESAGRLGYEYLLAVGEYAEVIVKGARKAGMTGKRAQKFADKEALVTYLRKEIAAGTLGRGDWLLVKGSRGMRMETIISELEKVVEGEAV